MTTYQEISAQFYSNRLLFGDPGDPGVVAVEVASKTEIDVYKRLAGKLTRERRPIRLFAIVENMALLEGFKAPHETRVLDGDFRYRILVTFDSLDALDAARRHLRNVTDKAPNAPDAPYLVLADPVEQHLMLTGTTFFIGTGFQRSAPPAARYRDLHLAGLRISVGGARGRSRYRNLAHRLDRFRAPAQGHRDGRARDARGDGANHRRSAIPTWSKATISFASISNTWRRARAAIGCQLRLGRDGGETARASVAHANRRTLDRIPPLRHPRPQHHRHLDPRAALRHREPRAGEPRAQATRATFRAGAQGSRLYRRVEDQQYFDHEPEKLFEYALDDARETRALAETLSPSYFVQAQIFPYSYQSAVLRGNATKIDALMMRAYLAAGHSIPEPSPPAPVAGGYTEIRRCGVAHGVLHCDVTSLYPSLMLQYRHAPAADRLGVFLKLLGDLRSFRVQAKALARELSGSERRNADALQLTFKILINSFYGYLGFSLGHFNDFDEANALTKRGRDLIQRAVAELEDRGAQVIEVDTDGIYFVPPPDAADDNERGAERLLEQVGAIMPEGIKLEIDGRYAAMFSYKMKNYVLLDETGKMTIRGSGLRSRGLERFQRRFMEEMFRLLLADRRDEIPKLHDEYRTRLARHEIGIADLMKTETLQDSLDTYRSKIGDNSRNLAAAYELALKAERPYLAGDQISYYVTGRRATSSVNALAKMAAEYDPAAPDENVEYYQYKLADLFEKFRIFVERPGLFVPVAETDDNPAQLSLFGAPQKKPEESNAEPEA